jgi:RNA-directed DNA polymerase
MNNYKQLLKLTAERRHELFHSIVLWKNFHLFRENHHDLLKHEINSILFLGINSPGLLELLLKADFRSIQHVVNFPVYNTYKIKKKSGGLRTIESPDETLMAIQKKLNFYLQSYYYHIRPKHVYGFVFNPYYYRTTSDANIVENAKVHVGKKYVLNIDLKDFFSNISAVRVKKMFSSKHFIFNEHMTNVLTLLVTYKGKLPTGAPTSPVISNFVCLDLDQSLLEFSKSNGLTYTRFADDLTFSSDEEITDVLLLMIKEVIRLNGFIVNNKKVRIKSSARQQKVTGIVVNEKVNVDRKYIKRIRAMLYHLKLEGLTAATIKHFGLVASNQMLEIKFMNRLSGYINFIGMVRGKKDLIFKKYDKDFRNIQREIENRKILKLN